MKLTFTTIIATISVLIQGTIGAAATTDIKILEGICGDNHCIAELMNDGTDGRVHLRLIRKLEDKPDSEAINLASFNAQRINEVQAQAFVNSIISGLEKSEFDKVVAHITQTA